MRSVCLLIFSLFMGNLSAQEHSIFLTRNGISEYKILIPQDANRYERRAATVLRDYIRKVTGATLEVGQAKNVSNPALVLERKDKLPEDEFEIRNDADNIVLAGNGDRSILFAAYHFIENYLHCKKWAPGEPADCPHNPDLLIPLPIRIREKPSFQYREVYSTAEDDQEYIDWHKLHQLNNAWGLWGHSYYKLVDSKHFERHPEYFAWYDGKRRPNQLCLTNKAVLEISLQTLKRLMNENPHAKYWSVSPNDDSGHCECNVCKAINEEEGGPQGTLIRFVNKIAEKYPDKTFTTLAYGETTRPTLITKPLPNVIIFLSNIDAFRTRPVSTDKSAATFRRNLEGWKKMTPNIFVWDYYTQFTNYLAPFPDVLNIPDNIDFYQRNNVKGVFAQQGGENWVYQNDLKSYVLSKKLWNSQKDEDELIDEFLTARYGKAMPLIKTYLHKISSYVKQSGRNLDIYGNPVNEYNSYLTPEIMDECSRLFDRAETIADNEKIAKNIQKLRLSFDYTYLQQARFYGRRKHGIYMTKGNKRWEVREDLPKRVDRFLREARSMGITSLSEEGYTLNDYEKEWQHVFELGALNNLAENSDIIFSASWIEDFPANKEKTLTDCMYGFKDFSYNWLLFDKPVTVTLDFGKHIKINTVTLSFLEDQRHWIFLPRTATVSVSQDGVHYTTLPAQHNDNSETTTIKTLPMTFEIKKKIQYLRVTALPLEALPEWRRSKHKKPLFAMDEVWVK